MVTRPFQRNFLGARLARTLALLLVATVTRPTTLMAEESADRANESAVAILRLRSQTTERLAEARSLLEQASAAGSVEAAYNLGLGAETGVWAGADRESAELWYTRAAEAGFPDAMERLGFMEFDRCQQTRAIIRCERARQWFTRLAKGFRTSVVGERSRLAIAVMDHQRWGTPSVGSPASIRETYESQSRRGNLAATINLAVWWIAPPDGAESDVERAIRLLEIAAAKGAPKAKTRLALLLARDQEEGPLPERVRELLEQADAEGDTAASSIAAALFRRSAADKPDQSVNANATAVEPNRVFTGHEKFECRGDECHVALADGTRLEARLITERVVTRSGWLLSEYLYERGIGTRHSPFRLYGRAGWVNRNRERISFPGPLEMLPPGTELTIVYPTLRSSKEPPHVASPRPSDSATPLMPVALRPASVWMSRGVSQGLPRPLKDLGELTLNAMRNLGAKGYLGLRYGYSLATSTDALSSKLRSIGVLWDSRGGVARGVRLSYEAVPPVHATVDGQSVSVGWSRVLAGWAATLPGVGPITGFHILPKAGIYRLDGDLPTLTADGVIEIRRFHIPPTLGLGIEGDIERATDRYVLRGWIAQDVPWTTVVSIGNSSVSSTRFGIDLFLNHSRLLGRELPGAFSRVGLSWLVFASVDRVALSVREGAIDNSVVILLPFAGGGVAMVW